MLNKVVITIIIFVEIQCLKKTNYVPIQEMFNSEFIVLSFQIFSNLFGIHHDERFWPDPWTFKPERFLTPEGTIVPDDHPVMKK